ncbi:tripartite tricarboxylate transporter substrate binding protein [Bordetella sp. 15P40C-2]|uniref:Bug family tripartite tricarboxylate transporter substrate binding protein n=1 Tax=Bordetella sp. 15P40C-2 TaxID=2572246 RepID=UPI001325F122|nr:tripartite tricarboxylate transporter substrate binding protein [Bordetella sp. 15P40C-2]MVW70682.1 tripartite tricarboxylate transporter substrate binding protein [Bordetella sp. 15P40C-2]
MKVSIKHATLSVLSLAILSGAPAVHADDYPSKPITFIVGYPPGGASDVISRLIAGHMQTALKQPVIVKNQPGVNGNIATEDVAKAPADGYTLLLGTIANSINASLLKNIHHDVNKDFIPVVQFMSSPSVLVVTSKLPVKSVAELVALAKEKPGALSYASTGSGSSPHLAGELFKLRTGTDMLHVPYKGAAPALTDVIAGHVQTGFKTALSALPSMQDGSIRPVAVADKQRMPELPNVPTMAEAGYPDFEVLSWNGIFVPAGTPPQVVEKLNSTVNDILKNPEIVSRIRGMAGRPGGGTPEQFRTLVQSETEKWGEVIRQNNITQQ